MRVVVERGGKLPRHACLPAYHGLPACGCAVSESCGSTLRLLTSLTIGWATLPWVAFSMTVGGATLPHVAFSPYHTWPSR